MPGEKRDIAAESGTPHARERGGGGGGQEDGTDRGAAKSSMDAAAPYTCIICS